MKMMGFSLEVVEHWRFERRLAQLVPINVLRTFISSHTERAEDPHSRTSSAAGSRHSGLGGCGKIKKYDWSWKHGDVRKCVVNVDEKEKEQTPQDWDELATVLMCWNWGWILFVMDHCFLIAMKWMLPDRETQSDYEFLDSLSLHHVAHSRHCA